MTLYSEIDSEDYVESIEKALMRKGGSSKFPSNEEIKVALKDKDLSSQELLLMIGEQNSQESNFPNSKTSI